VDAVNLLRGLRGDRGVTREELAARAGVDADAVAGAEDGAVGEDALAPLFSALAMLGFERSGVHPADLDDPALIRRQRAMSMSRRLEAGFELCELASSLRGAARR
jgi:transcriptional regulator with XRE-family HTH domain